MPLVWWRIAAPVSSSRPWYSSRRVLVEPDRLRDAVVRADDRRVAAGVARGDVVGLEDGHVRDAVPGREVVGGGQAVAAAADDDDVVRLASGRPASGSAAACGCTRSSAHPRRSRELVGVGGVATTSDARRRRASHSLAGTPAIAPWASAGRLGGSGHSMCARRCSARSSDQAPTKPCSSLDDRVRVVRGRRRAPRRSRSASSGREAAGPVTRPDSPRQRAPSSAAGSATTRRPRSGSSAGTEALRVVERGRRDDRLAAVDLDAVAGTASAAASRASAPCRGAARSSSRSRCRRSRRRHRRSACPRPAPAPSIVKPTQRRWSGELGGPLERRPADEPRLVHPDRPVHPEPPRRRVELGVHADDDVALLEPEPEQRLEAVRPDAEVRAERPCSARHSSTDRSTGWCSSKAASPVNERRMTWHGTPATSAWTWPRKRGGSARPARASSSPASGPVTLIAASDIVRSRTWTRRPHVSIQSRSHISAFAAPPRRERQHEAGLRLAQDHAVVHDVAALVEQQRVARPAGLDVARRGTDRAARGPRRRPGPETTSLPSVLTSPIETPSRTAQYSATASP